MSIEDKKAQLSNKVFDKRTICEVHRELYDIVEEHFGDSDQYKEFVARLEEAYVMAKKMDAKLRQYKFNYDDAWWEEQSAAVQKEKLERRGSRN